MSTSESLPPTPTPPSQAGGQPTSFNKEVALTTNHDKEMHRFENRFYIKDKLKRLSDGSYSQYWSCNGRFLQMNPVVGEQIYVFQVVM